MHVVLNDAYKAVAQQMYAVLKDAYKAVADAS